MSVTNRLPQSIPERALQWGKFGLQAGASALSAFIRENPGSRKDKFLADIAKPAVETMMRLRGGPMKIGQLLSMQDFFLPEQFVELLQPLQNAAPQIELNIIRRFLAKQGIVLDDYFSYISEKPVAAASIGQVHETRTREGETYLTKFQYPGIANSIRSDLRLVKMTLKPVISLLIETNQKRLWEEIEERLLEEVNFDKELSNHQLYFEKYQGSNQIVIPEPIPHLSSRWFITSKPLYGESLSRVCSYDQAARDQWGLNLFHFQLREIIFSDRFHADPHPGNYAFLPGGKLIVYDFGQIKPLEKTFQENYRTLLEAIVSGDLVDVQQGLWDIGIAQVRSGRPVSIEMVSDHLDIIRSILKKGSMNAEQIKQLVAAGEKYWHESRKLEVPHHLLFLHRTFAGMGSLISKLGSQADWGSELKSVLKKTPVAPC